MGRLLSFLTCICTSFFVAHADPGWVRLPLIGPHDDLGPGGTAVSLYYLNNIQIGTPPASESLVLDLQSTLLGVSSSDCAFCPGANLFDPSMSSTYKVNKTWDTNTTFIGGVIAQDTVSFGGVLTNQNCSLAVFQRMATGISSTRFSDGYFGLWVDPANETVRQQHIFSRLHSAGNLMNPVVGFRMGRTPETSSFTIGALDENDYDGTINWIETEDSGPPLSASGGINIDGFRGFNGSFLPSPGPLRGFLHSFNRAVYVPDVKTYMSEEGYRGPGDPFALDDANSTNYHLPCNNTLSLSVQINGVSYEIESRGNLLRKMFSDSDTNCTTGINNFQPPDNNITVLGMPFLRSVYIAYRFPTADCPKAYYGFAFQKGANRTSSMIAQQPSSTPSASAQCLSFTKPTATPSVSTPPPQVSANQFVSKDKYGVWGDPDSAQVQLLGVEYLKAGRA